MSFRENTLDLPESFMIEMKSRQRTGACTCSWNRAGFSLIEVVVAIAIVSYAIMAVFSLLPIGLSTFQKAADTSINSEILQQVMSGIGQTDFSVLVKTNGVNESALLYFDDQGNPTSGPAGAVYQVAYGVTSPALLVTQNSSSLAQVTIDIVKNPANKTLTRDTATGGILANPANGIVVSRYSAFVANNQ